VLHARGSGSIPLRRTIKNNFYKYKTVSNMISKVEIEKLKFSHLGSRWWKNNNDTIRLRQWKDNEIDIWRWGISEDKQNKVFQGTLMNIEEIQRELDRL
jgi:hypothetical protein